MADFGYGSFGDYRERCREANLDWRKQWTDREIERIAAEAEDAEYAAQVDERVEGPRHDAA